MGTNQPLNPQSIMDSLKTSSIEEVSKTKVDEKVDEKDEKDEKVDVIFDIEGMAPKLEEILEIVKLNSFGLQFKRSLEYVQGGTNMTLDRMIKALDNVMATAYLDGYVAGLKSMSKVASQVIDKTIK